MLATILLLHDVGPTPSFDWMDAANEYIGFLSYFAVFGALGFYFFVVRRMGAWGALGGDGPGSANDVAVRSAARIGAVGAILMIVQLHLGAMMTASDKGVSFGDVVHAPGSNFTFSLVCMALILVGYGVAIGRMKSGWVLAAIAAVVLAFQSIVTLKWTTLVNPIHEVAASLWIGTLFVLVVAGLSAVLRSTLPTERRGTLVAELVARFSQLALVAASILVLSGIVTAWRHLKFVAALWTTSYGITLDIKLVFVATVAGLGAWNWKRMSPRLGTEAAAHDLRRSARAELIVAAIVLVCTAVLVTVPSPRLPHP